ncbi:hypothetical protein HID58_061837 [Brassica napus]|uniref:Uncharacterized protein n=1 Tax=Brassica napus TaxID=3708 RepID=A0ABQ8A0M3_BRANA|nr:hypothetical protein HID58_061837 [Brassica napus]
MMTRGEERKRDGEKPTKYFGKWPLKYVYGIQIVLFCVALLDVRLWSTIFKFLNLTKRSVAEKNKET